MLLSPVEELLAFLLKKTRHDVTAMRAIETDGDTRPPCDATVDIEMWLPGLISDSHSHSKLSDVMHRPSRQCR